MNCTRWRNSTPPMPAQAAPIAKCKQRVRGDVDAEALGTDRIVAQRRERAAHGDRSSHHSTSPSNSTENEREVEEREVAVERKDPNSEGRGMPEMPNGAAGQDSARSASRGRRAR
jgi:hypothetical protein